MTKPNMKRYGLLLPAACVVLSSLPLLRAGEAAAGKSIPEPRRERLSRARAALVGDLRENVIPFWLPGALDRDHGGYRLNHDASGKWRGAADKHLVTQARTVWFFSRLQRSRFRSREYLDAARHGFRFLRDHLWDDRHGGFFWAVDSTGARPVKPDKHLYAQAFGLYALSEYHLVSQDAEALQLARDLFRLLEEKAHDEEHGGYRESFARDWTPLDAEAVNYMAVTSGLKLMNTHLHLMEAMTTYYLASRDPLARQRLVELIFVEASSVVRKDLGACTDRHRRDWTPLRGPAVDRVSYGHDIENVWLLLEACDVAGIPQDVLVDLHRSLFDYSLAHGYDAQRGGFYDSGPFHQDADRRQKTWWVQAECLVSALKMHRRTGDALYLEVFFRTLDWILEHQVDRENGDWHASITAEGQPRGDKAGAWKSPYHNGRALLECIEELDDMLRDGD